MKLSRRQLRDRFEIIDRRVRAGEAAVEITAARDGCEDQSAARSVLMEEPFNFSEIQAMHAVDAQRARWTAAARAEMLAERSRLGQEPADLDDERT